MDKQLIRAVKINYDSVWKKVLCWLTIFPKSKNLYVTELSIATTQKLLAILSSGPELELKDQKQLFESLCDNIHFVYDFIAIGLHNSRKTPPKWIYEALERDFTINEILEIFHLIYDKMGIDVLFRIQAAILPTSTSKMFDSIDGNVKNLDEK